MHFLNSDGTALDRIRNTISGRELRRDLTFDPFSLLGNPSFAANSLVFGNNTFGDSMGLTLKKRNTPAMMRDLREKLWSKKRSSSLSGK